jgi:hypothetical protein
VAHRRLLHEKQQRLERLIASVEQTLEALEGSIPVEKTSMFDGFDESTMEEYRREAKERWGQTDAYAQSERRTARYTKADWDAIAAEGKEIVEGMAARMDRDPADPEVQALIARHHQQINERFYDCSTEIYRGLATMYVDDPRFAANYEAVHPGLAAFMRDAMLVRCDRLEAADRAAS